MIEQGLNSMIEVTEEERFRAKLRSQRMYQTDLASDLATAEDRGVRRGIEIGKHNVSIEIARKLLRRDWPINEIAEVTDLSVEEVESLKDDEHRQK